MLIAVTEKPDQAIDKHNLVSLLDSLAAQGTPNSSGVFTVDVSASLSKLQRFQLPNPYFGVLKVIQSAIASQATFIETKFNSRMITIEHDGLPPNTEQLRNLFSYLLTSNRDSDKRALRDLAVGLNTSLARGASWVEISVKDGHDWVQQRWVSRAESTVLNQPNRKSRSRFRFSIRHARHQTTSSLIKLMTKTDIFQYVTGHRQALLQDAQIVFDRCRFLPVRLILNGYRLPPMVLNRPVIKRWSVFKRVEHRPANLLEVCLYTQEPSPHLLVAPPKSSARFQLSANIDFDGQAPSAARNFRNDGQPSLSRNCFAILGIRPSWNLPAELVVVKDGVELTRLSPPSLPRGVSVVMVAEGMPLDLSQFRLIDNKQTHERLEWLTEMLIETAHRALELIPKEKLSPAYQERLASLQSAAASSDPVDTHLSSRGY